MAYTLSQAANQLLVKRSSLIRFEQLQTELGHCVLRSSSWRYNQKEMTLLRNRLVEIYKQGMTLDQYLDEQNKQASGGKAAKSYGTKLKSSSKPKSVRKNKPAGKLNRAASLPSDSSIGATKSAIKSTSRVHSEDYTEVGEDEDLMRYADKLYNESLGQGSFEFVTRHQANQPIEQVSTAIPDEQGVKDRQQSNHQQPQLDVAKEDVDCSSLFVKLSQLEKIVKDPACLKSELDSLFDILLILK